MNQLNLNPNFLNNNLCHSQYICNGSELTLERCWDTWVIEFDGLKDSNRKYIGWTQLGMKRYTGIASAVGMLARECAKRRNLEEQ